MNDLHDLREISISLCMIVKNEEGVIAHCLDTVKDIIDEIIILDTGSTDRTKEIVSRYTDRIYDFSWIDDFAAARNYSFSHATKEYILWLDADDVVLEEDRQKLLELKKTMDMSIDAVNMHYVLAYDQHGSAIFSLRRNRLVKACRHFQWVGAVHEYIEVDGIIQNSDIVITHKGDHRDSDRNLRIYENRLAKGEEFGPRDLYYYANELREHLQYSKAVEFYRKFLALDAGWVEDKISACSKLADCFNVLGDPAEERMSVLKSFNYDSPRAEFCCRLGYQDLQAGKYKQAVFWYKLAAGLENPTECWGPINHAYWTWLPHLQLCVCYDRMGQHELAYQHNEIARTYIPDDPRVLHNKKYLEDLVGLNPLL
ncbi:MAG: glycosyltransferase family 2 protein [Deltaproteobacteria bacterium]|nr:glycosyltransferase family 2 protein [Deltaproteobacteria bacterium]